MRNYAIPLLAFCALISVGGCSKARSDESITTDIKAGMFSDPQAKSAAVDVQTKNGVVTLTGDVADTATRYEVFKIAREIPGVKNVNDQMTLQQAAASVAQAAPAPSPSPAASARAARKAERKKERSIQAGKQTPDRAYDNGQAAQPVEVSAPQPPAPADTAAAAAPVESAPAPPPAPPPQPRQVELPAGTAVRVQMIDPIDSDKNHPGDQFHASVASPIVINGDVIVPAGVDIYVRLEDASSAGRLAGRSELGVVLSRLDFQGKSYSLETTEVTQTGSSRGKSTAVKIGGGAAIGAALGAIIGGGKGAAIGAGVGGAGGTAAAAATKGQQVHIASEAKLDFTLQQPVTLTYLPDANSSR
jgi:hypothetical protein